jgi:hypothetical protein
MAHMVIKDISKKYDGEYELVLGVPNPREWQWITAISGFRPLTLQDGVEGGDPALIVAMAVIAMERAGKIQKSDWRTSADELMEVPFDGDHIYVIPDDEPEDDAGPPDLTSTPDA